jgi:hypothetical protein
MSEINALKNALKNALAVNVGALGALVVLFAGKVTEGPFWVVFRLVWVRFGKVVTARKSGVPVPVMEAVAV